MNRIVIIFILLGSLCLVSGCIEVSYKGSEASLSLFSKKAEKPVARPRIVDDGYPKPLPAVFASQEVIDANYSSYKSRPIMSINKPRRKRGFTSFKRREK
jgi:hypothetical protein